VRARTVKSVKRGTKMTPFLGQILGGNGVLCGSLKWTLILVKKCQKRGVFVFLGPFCQNARSGINNDHVSLKKGPKMTPKSGGVPGRVYTYKPLVFSILAGYF
jgi:hypothetical protein